MSVDNNIGHRHSPASASAASTPTNSSAVTCAHREESLFGPKTATNNDSLFGAAANHNGVQTPRKDSPPSSTQSRRFGAGRRSPTGDASQPADDLNARLAAAHTTSKNLLSAFKTLLSSPTTPVIPQRRGCTDAEVSSLSAIKQSFQNLPAKATGAPKKGNVAKLLDFKDMIDTIRNDGRGSHTAGALKTWLEREVFQHPKYSVTDNSVEALLTFVENATLDQFNDFMATAFPPPSVSAIATVTPQTQPTSSSTVASAAVTPTAAARQQPPLQEAQPATHGAKLSPTEKLAIRAGLHLPTNCVDHPEDISAHMAAAARDIADEERSNTAPKQVSVDTSRIRFGQIPKA